MYSLQFMNLGEQDKCHCKFGHGQTEPCQNVKYVNINEPSCWFSFLHYNLQPFPHPVIPPATPWRCPYITLRPLSSRGVDRWTWTFSDIPTIPTEGPIIQQKQPLPIIFQSDAPEAKGHCVSLMFTFQKGNVSTKKVYLKYTVYSIWTLESKTNVILNSDMNKRTLVKMLSV